VTKVPSPAIAIEPLTLTTSDGCSLEAELAVPGDCWAGVVLAHPHPMQGGTMHSLVIGVLFDALPAQGVAAVRFNFRGVEGSSGTYDHGLGERADVVAALDALHPIVEGMPVALAGWSFGADTALSVDDDRAGGWFAVAPPLREKAPIVAGSSDRPKVLAVPEHDAFCPPPVAAERTAAWRSTTLETIPGADHFLVGRTDLLTPLCVGLLRLL
jgi:alpha/beta superfamily hydrolase